MRIASHANREFKPLAGAARVEHCAFANLKFSSQRSRSLPDGANTGIIALKLMAPRVFASPEAADIFRTTLGVSHDSNESVHVRFLPRFYQGSSRTTARADVTIQTPNGERFGSFAVKLLTGSKSSCSLETARNEVKLSQCFADQPLFQKHFAPSFGVVTVPVTKAIHEKLFLDEGIHPAAIPQSYNFQINRWSSSIPIEKVVSGYLRTQSQQQLKSIAVQETLVTFGSRLVKRVQQCWELLKYKNQGLLFDTGREDFGIAMPPGSSNVSPTEVIRIGEPVFFDGDGNARSGGQKKLAGAIEELVWTLHSAILASTPYFNDRIACNTLAIGVLRKLREMHRPTG